MDPAGSWGVQKEESSDIARRNQDEIDGEEAAFQESQDVHIEFLQARSLGHPATVSLCPGCMALLATLGPLLPRRHLLTALCLWGSLRAW